jgi:surfeit locus 1 family protein
VRLRSLVLLLAAAAVAAACVRLGFWQLGRWNEKRRLNAHWQSLLAAAPLRLDAASVMGSGRVGRKLVITGRYDEARQFLLLARFHAGEPGVEIVTPLAPDSGPMVLVNRGWVPAPDAATARPRAFPEPGRREVLGVIEPLDRGVHRSAMLRETGDSAQVFTTEALDFDSVSARLPYPIAAWMVRELPGPDAAALPLRQAPPPLDESMHLGYAIQWFAIALIFLVGGAALVRSQGARAVR